MHLSSLIIMYDFFKKYLKPGDSILDVGSRLSEYGSPSYKDVLELTQIKALYTGLDIEGGDNVDVVLEKPYEFPLIDACHDIVISGQMLEHCEFFWLTFKEMARVLKPGGYMCVIAPKLQKQHRFPVDCWRFQPDGMLALAKWAGITCLRATADHCNFTVMPNRVLDCVGVFQK